MPNMTELMGFAKFNVYPCILERVLGTNRRGSEGL